MKKIIFNDRYGLTEAVLEGRKTMTRRIAPDGTPLGNWEETVKKSRYKVGDVVAVAQAYRDTCWTSPVLRLKDKPGWSNKMFVYAGLMPHQIRITNVRVERLQDISDEDCIREGIQGYTCVLHEYQGNCYSFDGDKSRMGTYQTPRSAFSALIDKISGKGTWESNPWVFVYEFELEK